MGGKEMELTGITAQDFLDMICEKCHAGLLIETGVIDQRAAEPECDCCPLMVIASEICEVAGIT